MTISVVVTDGESIVCPMTVTVAAAAAAAAAATDVAERLDDVVPVVEEVPLTVALTFPFVR